ncbi:MAG: hypothetical protein NDP13_03780 [Crenarchaeota archaeon]|nr:hypothetical protein [Thermoproteota archaeon]MCR8454091.1 hypothetical protein [Thermoproteota archaeon]MCR8455421.1 hypothetical protein [Thermoproteota archaeon]MCR8463500.1 hypothetical protein [Thermoproteota archaeon]MCR8470909.1 hypothetical protein [Thermoproteota archaeon]
MSTLVRVTVPGGISAIFEPCIHNDPIASGARGAGIGFKDAVEVELKIFPSEKLIIENSINGQLVRGGIGEIAVKTFFGMLGIEPEYKVIINQKISIPMGSGFGTSAASALGIVLALSKELNVPLSVVQAGDIAHLAEIRAKSGLGTVSGLVNIGDIVIVVHPGAPSVCLVDRIPLPSPDVRLVVASKGRIETAEALRDRDLVNKAMKLGKVAVDELLQKPTIENFFKLARWFAENVGLMTKTIEYIIVELSKFAIGAAQSMIGDAIFALVWREDVDDVLKIIDDLWHVSGIVGEPVSSGFYLE